MGSLLERLAERERAARDRVEQLRGQTDPLTAQLAEAESAMTRPETTRESVLAPAAEDEAPGGYLRPSRSASPIGVPSAQARAQAVQTAV
ncbi:hypothetical protein [Kitasatospora sp. KL5]|uniref:hypothetical protein n=1 Tax=Kitasatospora sp. KL5 TaxID=3425125 RepID=UPI003D6ED2C2